MQCLLHGQTVITAEWTQGQLSGNKHGSCPHGVTAEKPEFGSNRSFSMVSKMQQTEGNRRDGT